MDRALRRSREELAACCANRRIREQYPSRRSASGGIDFVTIDDADRRDRSSSDRLSFDPLRNQRAGYEDGSLVRLFLIVRGLIDRFVTKGEASRKQTRRACRKQRSHA